MTREKAIMIAWTDKIQDFVNKIYDDFESRTCENCRYGESEDLGIYCPFVSYCGSDYMQKDFECKKFESKTVSTDTKSLEQD